MKMGYKRFYIMIVLCSHTYLDLERYLLILKIHLSHLQCYKREYLQRTEEIEEVAIVSYQTQVVEYLVDK